MERTPAASAMQWSIDLEKGLRSKRPGEAILQIGQKLEWWDRDSFITEAEYKLFGLIPGEDKLFADAIFLRLAHAFNSGDKHTRACIVKIFMWQRRRWSGHDRKSNRGIISKGNLESHVELLKRVKSVFYTGDSEERAMVLALLGCWAGFAKDNADIRYLILSSLVSNDIMEVKASLFAAGCFCELADDFAAVLLEMLENLMSREASKAIRLAAGRALAKIWFSILLAHKAYKTGVKLMLESRQEEEFCKIVLISLSKIASKWTSLIPVQVELLISFLSEEVASCLQASALKCLNFMLCHGVIIPESTADRVLKFLDVLNESKLSPNLQCVACSILYKVFLYNLHRIPRAEILIIFSRFLSVVSLISESPAVISERFLAFHNLADICDKLLEKSEEESSGHIGSTVASRIISFAMDRFSLLVKSNKDVLLQPNSVVKQEIKCLFSLLLDMFEKKHELSALLLDKVFLLVRDLVNTLNEITRKPKVKDISVDHPQQEENSKSFAVSMMICASKVVFNCFRNQESLNSVSPQVIDNLKLLVKHVCGCRPLHIYIHVIYSLLLHSCLECTFVCRIMNTTGDLHSSPHQYETSAIDSVRVILGRKENWLCYKLGKYAMCQGAWLTAALIFERQSTIVQSEACRSWLESLTHLSRMESKFQSLFNFDLSENTTSRQSFSVEATLGACNDLCSSVCRLGGPTSSTSSGLAFRFQKWFLTLRVKVVQAVVDAIKLSVSFSSTDMKNKSLESSSLVHAFGQVSYTMKSLAHEFDLFATSFIGIDRESRAIVSSLSITCSLLAFTTVFFSFLLANASEGIITAQAVDEHLSGMLSRDLFRRLFWHIDNESSKYLLGVLSKFSGNTFFLQQWRNQSSRCCEFAKLCRYAFTMILNLRTEVVTSSRSLDGDHKKIDKSKILSHSSKLMFSFLSIWIRIPWRTPKHFFQMRPCVGSELFLLGEDGEKVNRLSVSSGFLLHLNLCLQLKNMPSKISKLYCVLHARSSKTPSQDEVDDMIYLNQKLLEHTRGNNIHDDDDDIRGGVFSFVCFEVKSEKWQQGFSTCLLDTSAFPVGSYEIKWHSCCIDNEGSYWSFIPVLASSFAFSMV
ncbi:hypothetical protein DM860_010483 [Cuscuta australis]|uniref:Integrator complex subunit 7 n=1 Tax=Cuscuta australis TaxID=267555 RepID=A0A328E1B2_9ASTE|nr:hypothetical protein DM860_010483 [Cuscuta australis]